MKSGGKYSKSDSETFQNYKMSRIDSSQSMTSVSSINSESALPITDSSHSDFDVKPHESGRGSTSPIKHFSGNRINKWKNRKHNHMVLPGLGSNPGGCPSVSVGYHRGQNKDRHSPNKEGTFGSHQYDIVSGGNELIVSLEHVMRLQGCYETKKGLETRRDILAQLNILVREWIKSIALARRMPWHNLDHIGGRIVTYGSYQLGISHQGADIDALCIAPNFISRQEYFTSFLDYLRLQPDVTELRAIEEAYVPVIKFRYTGVEIDMTFTQLRTENVPSSDAELLRYELYNVNNLDQKCLRSLNGYRSTILILQLVPDVDKFRLVLRAIKLWAQGQGLYSNVLGYLGGFSWAVLGARICMDFPDLSAPELLHKFFEVFSSWPWPEPVALINFQQSDLIHLGGLDQTSSHSSWNPEKNIQERFQVMPILTPTYPHQNSTFNVTANTLLLIKEKMGVAADICANILEGKDTWETLFQTRHIFHEYDHFLIVIASALQPASPAVSQQNSVQWFGLIESKIRHFVSNLEKECRQNIRSARIWPKPFSKKAERTSILRQLWFIGLKFEKFENFDFSRPLQSFIDMVLKQSFSFYTKDMNLEAHFVLKSQLTSHLTETEIQEIVASQSQKACEVFPVSVSSKPCSEDGRSSPASAVKTSSSSSSYAAVVSNNNQENFTATVSTDRALLGVSVIPASHVTASHHYYGQHTVRARIGHHHGSYHHYRSPIMERTWTSSGPTTYLGRSQSMRYNYDRDCVKRPDVVERTGSDSSPASTPGLDVSFSSVESDNGRSVSYSSDKFPPPYLVQEGLHHVERIPFTCPPPHTSQASSTASMYTSSTPMYDSSVPPPPSPVLSKSSFSSARQPNLTSQQRMSISEIRDVNTPLPVRSNNFPPVRFNFNSATIQQLKIAQDSVFT